MRAVGFVAMVAVAACGGGHAQPDAVADAGPRCDPTAPFGAPVPLASLNTANDDVTARLTPDELTVVFSRLNDDMTYDLYTSTRATLADPFATPEVMGSVNSIYSDVWPSISPDGLTLFFQSDRVVPGTYHIWVSHRASVQAPFGPPTEVMELQDADVDPYITATGTALYFSSIMRPGAGMGDVWRADLDASFTPSAPADVIGGVNTAAPEDAPAVTGDELQIFMRRDTPNPDIYTASRTSIVDGFGAATSVDGVSVAGVDEAPNWVSPDGCDLYFHSNAPGGVGGADLYMLARGM